MGIITIASLHPVSHHLSIVPSHKKSNINKQALSPINS